MQECFTIEALPTIAISTAPACSADLTQYSVSVTVSTGASVTSDSGTVVDNGADNWTVRMGESDEQLYNCEEIESLYQEWLAKNES